MTTKERLHQLIDQLPEPSAERAEGFLRYLLETGDPVLAALNSAPIDDEPETEEERALVEEAWEDWRAGRVVSMEEVEAELGLTPSSAEEALRQVNDEVLLAEEEIAKKLRALRERLREIGRRMAG